MDNHLEGVRANFSGPFGSGWFIVRLSLHEPLLVWTMENDQKGKTANLIEHLLPFFMEQAALDTKNIIKK